MLTNRKRIEHFAWLEAISLLLGCLVNCFHSKIVLLLCILWSIVYFIDFCMNWFGWFFLDRETTGKSRSREVNKIITSGFRSWQRTMSEFQYIENGHSSENRLMKTKWKLIEIDEIIERRNYTWIKLVCFFSSFILFSTIGISMFTILRQVKCYRYNDEWKLKYI